MFLNKPRSTICAGVPHSAFADQSCPADTPPRASIEIRMFAFYEDPAR